MPNNANDKKERNNKKWWNMNEVKVFDKKVRHNFHYMCVKYYDYVMFI